MSMGVGTWEVGNCNRGGRCFGGNAWVRTEDLSYYSLLAKSEGCKEG